MHVLLQEAKLQAIVNAVVPADLKQHIKDVGDILEGEGPRIQVNALEHEEFRRLTQELFPERKGEILGMTVKWQQMMELANELIGNPKDKFSIYIDERIYDSQKLAFVVLHEFGHVKWELDEETRKMEAFKDNEELFADFFAFDTLWESSGELDTSMAILQRYGSGRGWQSHVRNYRAR